MIGSQMRNEQNAQARTGKTRALILVSILCGSGSAALFWRNAQVPKTGVTDEQARLMGFSSAASSEEFLSSEEKMYNNARSSKGMNEEDFQFVEKELKSGGKPAFRTLYNCSVISKPEQRRRAIALLDTVPPFKNQEDALWAVFRKWSIADDKSLLASLLASRNPMVVRAAKEVASGKH
jgi:hypothetical protein